MPSSSESESERSASASVASDRVGAVAVASSPPHDLDGVDWKAMAKDADHLSRRGWLKRFGELYLGDPKFREACEADADVAFRDRGIPYSAADFISAARWGSLSAHLSRSLAARYADVAPSRDAFLAATHTSYEDAKFAIDFVWGGRHLEGLDPRFRAWRRRHIARLNFVFGYAMTRMHMMLPYTVELTEGCTVGCWFCGLSAPKFKRNMPAESDDLDEWRRMLQALGRLLGQYNGHGFLYWASEPLDHPEYMRLSEIFAEVTGYWPMTTTAVADRDVERTKALLRRARELNTPCFRFSIISPRQLESVFAAFSPEEMVDVPLALLNRGSLLSIGIAGRARDFLIGKKKENRVAEELDKLHVMNDDGETIAFAHDSICCVSGFLIRGASKTVSLVSPVPCSDEAPEGSVSFADAEYADAEEFENVIRDMTERYMPLRMPRDEPLRLPEYIRLDAARGVVRMASLLHEGTPLVIRDDLGASPGEIVEAAQEFLRERSREGLSPDAFVSKVAAAHPRVDRDALFELVETMWENGALIPAEAYVRFPRLTLSGEWTPAASLAAARQREGKERIEQRSEPVRAD